MGSSDLDKKVTPLRFQAWLRAPVFKGQTLTKTRGHTAGDGGTQKTKEVFYPIVQGVSTRSD